MKLVKVSAVALSVGFCLGRSVRKDSGSLSQLSIGIPVAMSAQLGPEHERGDMQPAVCRSRPRGR